MDAPVEPQACARAFSSEVDGLHYSWRGWGREKTSTIGVFNVQTEQWTLTPTTGPPPSGLKAGGCATIMNHLYCLGGFDCPSWFNDLHKLNLETFQWSKVDSKSNSSEQPICKRSFGLIAINEKTLVCFGGYGTDPTHVQPGSTFIWDYGSDGWTNEFHFFDTQEGVWSSPQLKGERPPPCSAFTFTKVDQYRVIFYGGRQSDRSQPTGWGRLNDLYLFDFRKMEVTKVEPAQRDQWPEERTAHAACCLNYGEDSPMVLVSGGVGKNDEVLEDMWILDVNSCKWIDVTHESVRGRYGHSITATSLGPGLTEVLVFGGRLKLTGVPLAETTILRFERSLSVIGSPTVKWALVDVAHNNTRGSSQRLREKMEKIRQAIHPSSESDQVRRATVRLLEEANHRCENAERRLAESEYRLRGALRASQGTEQRALDAERRVQELITEIGRLQGELNVTVRRAQLAEQQLEDAVCQKEDVEYELEGMTKELAAHNSEVWRIPSRDVSTVRKIGTGGWGAVFEGRVKVAVKELHDEINSPHNIEKVHREMRLLAEVRHPNLVQFIGAVFDRSPPLIVAELLDMNLQQAYQQNRVGPGERLSIFIDVANALDYLHQRYEPIIHRDVSAPNVLLQQMPDNQWKGKVSDLGSANFLQNAQTMGEGAIVYSPPEVIPRAYNPRREQVWQTTKIDVYSYGVLLCEVTTNRFPSAENYWDMVERVRRDCPQLHALIEHCTQERPDDRPTMEAVLVRLNRQDMPRV